MALTNLVDTYYKPEYEELRTSLSDADTMDATLQSAKDTVDEVSLQFSAVKSLLEELKGEFTGELYGSVSSLIDEIDAAYYLISEGLAPTINGMKALGTDLETLKTEDGNYQTEKDNYSSANPYKSWTTEQRNTEEYSIWKSNLQSIETTLISLMTLCKQMQDSCDTNINLIDEFNSVVIDLRLKLVALVVAQGDTTIADVENMSLEEREAYLQDLLDKLKEGYERAKEAYIAAIDLLYNSENFEATCEFLNIIFPDGTEESEMIKNLRLGVDAGDSNPYGNGMGEMSYIATGQFFQEFLQWYATAEYNGNPIKDMIGSYMGGASLEESGLLDLYMHNCLESNAYFYSGMEAEDFERSFNAEISGSFHFSSEEELREMFVNGMQEIQQASDDFNRNYTDHVAKGLMYKSVLSLKKELRFDDIRQNDPAYRDYEYDPDLFERQFATPAIVNEGWVDSNGETQHGFTSQQSDIIEFLNDPGHLLTDNEKKMIGYLFSSGKYDEATNYITVIENGINRRSGEIQAERSYNSWLEGSNKGVDYVWDNVRAWGKGAVDGGYDYFESFKDIFDPDTVPTAHDYEIMRMQELISQPVYKVGDRYYSEGQINAAMASRGLVPIGNSPADGYTTAGGTTVDLQYDGVDIMPQSTLWDESIRGSYGAGFKVVETSVNGLANIIHPALGTAVEAAHDFGQAREEAEQRAFMENANLSSSSLNDGVDYGEFWAEQMPKLAKAGISIVGEFSEPVETIGKIVDTAEAVIEVPSTIDGVVASFSHLEGRPWYEIVYTGASACGTLISAVKDVTGGEVDFTPSNMISSGVENHFGEDSVVTKVVGVIT